MPDFEGPYGLLCDELWRDWLRLNGRLDPSFFIGGNFDQGSAPEPWLEFRAGENPLVAVTTNPGGSMPHQLHEAIVGGRSIIKPRETYLEATLGLGRFYETELGNRSPARHRINAFLNLAETAGYDGLFQVEACPFHSAKLPNKRRLVRAIVENRNRWLRNYTELLRTFLATHHVIGLSAISSLESLTEGCVPIAIRNNSWLNWFARLVGINPDKATYVMLTRRNNGMETTVTSAALVATVNGKRKALVLMMGGNRLPGDEGLAALADALR